MFRKMIFVILAIPMLLAALNTRVSFPLLLWMVSLLLVAIAAPSAREEI